MVVTARSPFQPRVPVQERARHKRESLMEAALAEFSEKDYEDVTTKSVAGRAGVAAGTFYQYFESKAAILREVVQLRLAAFTDLIVDADGVPATRILDDRPISAHIRASMELTYQFHAENRRLHGTIEHRRTIDPLLDEIAEAGDRVILDRVAAAFERWHVPDAKTTATVIVSMAEGLIHRQVFTDTQLAKDAALDRGAKIISEFLEDQIDSRRDRR